MRQLLVCLLCVVMGGCHFADVALGQHRTRRVLEHETSLAADEVREVRGAFDTPPVRLVRRKDVPAEIRTHEHQELPFQADLQRFEDAFGLRLSDDEQVTAFTESIGAWYSPEENEIVVVTPWRADDLGRMVLRHELVHARQDQVSRRLDQPPSTLDAFAALRLVLEGDATLAALAVEHGVEPRVLAEHLPGPGRFEGSDAERWYRHSLWRPYPRGSKAVLHHFEQGGWERVDDLLREPPSTSRKLLQPYGVVVPGLPDDDRPSFTVGALMLENLLATSGFATSHARYWIDDRFVSWEQDGQLRFEWTIRTDFEDGAANLGRALSDGIARGRPVTVEVDGTCVILRSE